jgi:hypothetical protein
MHKDENQLQGNMADWMKLAHNRNQTGYCKHGNKPVATTKAGHLFNKAVTLKVQEGH